MTRQVQVIPELVGHILECIPSNDFGPHLLEISPIWRAEPNEYSGSGIKKPRRRTNRRQMYLKKLKWITGKTLAMVRRNNSHISRYASLGFVTKESNKVEYLWIRVNTQMFKDGIIPATSLAEDLGLDLIDIYGIRKWEAMQASPLNDPDIVAEMYKRCKAELWKRHKEAEEVYDQAVDHYRKAIDDFNEADQKKYTRFAGMVVIERALLRCGFVTQESDWEKWTQMTYNIQLLKEGRTPDDLDDDLDDDSDDSDDEE
ncbi:unnamed protein product [Rhizophagus irregularis]|nr:unnamed protein product [Rhizophagus irregularis]